MNRLIAPTALCLLAAVAFGADAPPATQPTTKPTRPSWKDPAKMVESNPELEALMKLVPQNLMPPADFSKDDAISRTKRMREWDKTNIDGKEISAVGYRTGADRIGFYTPNGVRVEVLSVGKIEGPRGERIKLSGKLGRGGLLVVADSGSKEIRYAFTILQAKAEAAPK